MTSLRVLVVDDHPMVRQGLRSMLGGGDVEIVGEAGTGAEAICEAAERSPDVVLLDMKLPDLDGLAVLDGVRRAAPGAHVLVVSMLDDATLVRRALDAGARGWLLKGVSRRELVAAIRAVREGALIVDPALVRAVPSPALPPTAETLTALEHDVLRLIVEGLTNRQIGERMRWSLGTVKKYVQRACSRSSTCRIEPKPRSKGSGAGWRDPAWPIGHAVRSHPVLGARSTPP